MKFFLVIVIGLLFWCCGQRKNIIPATTKESLLNKPDTFGIRDLASKPSLQEDIPLDTVEIKPNKRHTGISIVLPKRLDQNYIACTKIDSVKRNKLKDFKETVKEEEVETVSGLSQGWGMWMNPKNLYQTGKIISYAIENGYGYTGMPSGYEYYTINFDIERKKEVRFSDYFRMDTRADTASLEKIINLSVGWRNAPQEHYLEWMNPVKFAVDKENIYFFFDKYGIFFASGQIGSLRKKYILDQIREEYRE